MQKQLELSLEALEFINGSLRYQEQDRFTAQEFFNHQYLKNANLEMKAVHNHETQHKIRMQLKQIAPNRKEQYDFMTSQNSIYFNIKKPDAFNEMYKESKKKYD